MTSDYGLLLYHSSTEKCVTYDFAHKTEYPEGVICLIQISIQASKYSHIALCGVLTVEECFWCRPLNRQLFPLPELVHIVLSVPH